MQMDIHRIWMKPYLIENQRMKLFCASIYGINNINRFLQNDNKGRAVALP